MPRTRTGSPGRPTGTTLPFKIKDFNLSNGTVFHPRRLFLGPAVRPGCVIVNVLELTEAKGRGVMRAVVVTEIGGPEVLVTAEHPDPTPGPGEVVVETAAAGVNFIDIYRRSGIYQQPLPYVPGHEGAGVVVAVGDGVTGVAVGDRVAWHDAPGSYAERVAVPAALAVPVPDGPA